MARILKQKAVERLLRHELPYLGRIIAGAWQRYLDTHSLAERLTHTPRSRASLVHDYMVDGARELAETAVHAEVRERGGLFMVLLHGRVAIRFKKLKDDLTTSNIPTQQSFEFSRQSLALPGVRHVTYLQAGYQLNRSQTKLSAAYLACPNGGRVEWAIPLKIESAAADVIALPTPIVTPPRLLPRVHVRKEESGDGQGS